MKRTRVSYQDETTKRWYTLSLNDEKVIYEIGIKTPEIDDALFQATYTYNLEKIFGELERVAIFWIAPTVFFEYRDGMFVVESIRKNEPNQICSAEEVEEILEIIKLPVKIFDIDTKIKNMFLEKLKENGYVIGDSKKEVKI